MKINHLVRIVRAIEAQHPSTRDAIDRLVRERLRASSLEFQKETVNRTNDGGLTMAISLLTSAGVNALTILDAINKHLDDIA